MKGFIYTAFFAVLLALITIFVYNNVEAPTEIIPAPTEDNVVTTATSTTVTMNLYETVTVGDVTLNAWAVTEDSRCPATANCIWAGRVLVAVNIGTAIGTSTNEFEIGESVTTENKKITLQEVWPQQTLSHKIADNEYKFVFLIEKHQPAIVTPMTPAPGKCYVGGCSGQVCSDTPGMASTCEYRESYACYKTATCERQATGQCGWTETAELVMCLRNAN